jgi:hypothetical protein
VLLRFTRNDSEECCFVSLAMTVKIVAWLRSLNWLWLKRAVTTYPSNMGLR